MTFGVIKKHLRRCCVYRTRYKDEQTNATPNGRLLDEAF
jgi:hypothetical protein